MKKACLAAVFGALAFGAGCAIAPPKKAQWTSRGTVEEFNRDADTCEKESYSARLGYARAIDANNAQSRYFELCLKEKGHKLEYVDAN